uniref:Ion-translocating oxidoreductase complex subunit C n=1 Tax=Candidatus Methanogaster sp. ANME-2c ERB4 TaxID=2759911 RepID=A0A7G9YFG6_9EURY|nr:ion-translocating oxidoreductase complex subunit C [Methanosarcinales archaeon ANME-2c ERB4]
MKIATIKTPDQVIIPLQQHAGAACNPLVRVGDTVSIGQLIGDGEFRIHSSVSGEVTALSEMPHPSGKDVLSVVIKTRNGEKKDINPEELHAGTIKSIIREFGIVEPNGLSTVSKKVDIDTIIINGTNTGDLSSNAALMLDHPSEIVYGLKALMESVGAKKAIIIIELNSEALHVMRTETIPDSNIKIVATPAYYPAGTENTLVTKFARKKVPRGSTPDDRGVLVSSIAAIKALYDAVHDGIPMIAKTVTVAGAVRSPGNVLVEIGTSVKHVIDECGGCSGTPVKIVINGAISGATQYSDEVPVIKTTSGILVQTESDINREPPAPCINCAWCVDECPIGLMPHLLYGYADSAQFDKCAELYISDCVECGMCAYVCPSKLPLVQIIRYGKHGVAEMEGGTMEAEA